jgi:hypothetical protein
MMFLAGVPANEQVMAQLVVGTNGLPLQTFEVIPPASSWSTKSLPGASADPESNAGVDAYVNGSTNAASTVTAPLSNVTGDPPAVLTNAQWTSSGYLCTRVTGNAVTLLMATLTNTTEGIINSFGVKYDYTQKTTGVANEVVKGHRVYYNLTGAAGKWMPLGDFGNSFTTNVVQAIDIQLDLGATPWTNGTLMYLLFADDNSSPNNDGANAIDNFRITNVVALLAPVITSHPQSTSVAPGGSVSFSVGVLGAAPFAYQWQKNSNSVPNATNATYTIDNAQFSDSGFYSVVVSNASGVAASSNAVLTVGCSSPVTISTQPQNHMLQSGAAFSLSVAASGTQPISYQWYRGAAAIPGATNATFAKTNVAPADSGLYRAVVTNCAGAQISSDAVVSVAETSYVLISLTNHPWKYEQSNTELGTSWRLPGYDDSPWPLGPGILGFENNAPGIPPLINTVLVLDSNGVDIITHYFRSHFTLTNDLSSVTLVASNYIDDGSVVYLNGGEAFRFNMPTGTVSFSTLASVANPLGEGVFFNTNLPSTLLVPGDNLLAVEVHQNSTTSADIVFGMAVLAIFPNPTQVQITNQPSDVVVRESESATLIAGVSGVAAHYQWFKDGAPVTGATAPTLTFNPVFGPDAGSYVLVVSNVINVVTSRVATLITLVDQTPPTLLAADLQDPTHVLATFSEPLLGSSVTNLANYSVTNTIGGLATITRAVLTNGTNVLLTTSSLNPNANYILTAAGVLDGSQQHNALPLSAVPVAHAFPLVAFDGMWEYFDPFPQFQDPDPSPGWKDLNYDTSQWGFDPAGFYYSQSGFAAPTPANTSLSVTPVYTAFFRNVFGSPFSPGGLTMKLSYAANDGVVFYLNGSEIHRFNLPAGNVSITAPAAATVMGAAFVTNITVTSPLLPGQNVLAAELHQATTNDTERFFAAELVARAESLLTGPLLVLGRPTDVIVIENQHASFRVSSVAAASFQWQMNDTDIPGATNDTLEFSAPLAFDGARFRLLISRSNQLLVTSNAVLHVIPDLSAPRLLSALASNDNTLKLTFSKPLDDATATNVSNYMVTNGIGATVAISFATIENGTTVVLHAASPLFFGRYGIVASNLRDQSVAQNVIAPGTAVVSGYSGLPVPFGASWRYDERGIDDGTGWRGLAFDDTVWSLGSGLFYGRSGAGPPLPAEPVSTTLQISNSVPAHVTTYYFRTKFDSFSTANTTVALRTIVDDGLVLFLNGAEIFRLGMGSGNVSYSTFANRTVDSLVEGPFVFTVTNVVAGENVLAAEVHQGSSGSMDVAFDLECRLSVSGGESNLPESPPRLRLTPIENQFAFTWDGIGFTLERADNVAGPWIPVATSPPLVITSTNQAAFFRLRR